MSLPGSGMNDSVEANQECSCGKHEPESPPSFNPGEHCQCPHYGECNSDPTQPSGRAPEKFVPWVFIGCGQLIVLLVAQSRSARALSRPLSDTTGECARQCCSDFRTCEVDRLARYPPSRRSSRAECPMPQAQTMGDRCFLMRCLPPGANR